MKPLKGSYQSRLGGVELGGIILTLMISLSQAYMFTPPDKKSLNCEDFCVSTGFQGKVGLCRCGYNLFSKRSDPSLLHSLMTRSASSPDPVLSGLTTKEIIDALSVLDRIGLHPQQKELETIQPKELKVILWLLKTLEADDDYEEALQI
ncbi:uncharacterized protein LOC111701399 [Eurytemora carolleeae]|uniref:uncharacterized protein LOC111701399 n=1 Tax=Eurytemora carolleeae TaxID=1294199 RepID=UPI000C78E58B|nr:uncharacterized protein LOC111701399 [Eurytemora carolleeae]|eukprot:XP_023328444.1 uncharacterized protein LOC111701399 [Eurytemora affinis]